MTYTLINAVFLIPAAVLLIAAWRTGRLNGKAVLLAGLVLVALTIVFDNLMIAVGLMVYSEAQSSGVVIGLMPIEDLAYTVFAAVALPALWHLLDHTRRTSATAAAREPGDVLEHDGGGEHGGASEHRANRRTEGGHP